MQQKCFDSFGKENIRGTKAGRNKGKRIHHELNKVESMVVINFDKIVILVELVRLFCWIK